MGRSDLKLKISQETYHLRQIIDSCSNRDQLFNAKTLCNNVIIKWFGLNDNLSLHDSIEVAHHIQAAANVLTSFLAEKATYIKQCTSFKHYYYD